ncbi:MAG: carboxymuconolactone decarboxylase family protein [Planctomycetota bacterium]|jgi:4-carboxymuconolactone decarboxylase
MATGPKRPTRRERISLLARIAALAALGRRKRLVALFRTADAAGVTIRAMRETILQTYLFAGFPRAVNALQAMDEGLGPRAPDAEEKAPRGEKRRRHFRERGERLFRRVYGPDTDRVLEAIGARHGEFRDWILEDAYGKVLGRRGLSAAERECLAVALLATLDLPHQQKPHVRGALRCGATAEEVGLALDAVEGLAPRRAVAFARDRLKRETP